jgi:3-phytase
LRKGVRIEGELQTLAVATNRTYNNIDIFRITDDGTVTFVMGQPVTFSDPYGICLYLDAQGRAHAFANSTDGEYQEWLLNPEGILAPQLLGSYRLDSQPEGCTVDDMTGILYAGEEAKGIWTMQADIAAFDGKNLLDVTGQGHLTADVEGMEIYRGSDSLYLIASSQGDNSYAIYDLDNHNKFMGSVRIADNLATGVDGAEETDGLTVTSIPLGPQFPAGMLVVQDGYNRLPVDSQNFKLVSWQAVMDALNAGNNK